MNESTMNVTNEQEIIAVQEETASEPNAPVGPNFNKLLAKFESACQLQAELNYEQALLASQYVNAFLKAAPGTALRSAAVNHLASASFRWSDDIFTLSEKEGTAKHAKRVCMLLNVNAVCTLIGDGSGLDKTQGKGRKGKGKQSRLPWGKVRELCPLVYRVESSANDEHNEMWELHPCVWMGDELPSKEDYPAFQLLRTMASAPDLTQGEIRQAVRKMRMEYALSKGDKVEAARFGYVGTAAEAAAVRKACHETDGKTVPVAEPVDHEAERVKQEEENEGEELIIVDGAATDVPAPTETVPAPAPESAAPVSPADQAAPVSTPSVPSGTGPKTDCYQGASILHTLAEQAKAGTAKDFADLLATSIRSHKHPVDVLVNIMSMLQADEVGNEDERAWITACLDCFHCENAK